MNARLLKSLVAAAAWILAGAASATPLSVWVDQTSVIGMHERFVRVSVSAPTVVCATKLPSGGVALVGKTPGVAHVELVAKDGSRFEFDVHVTHGAELYSLNRSEPEHLDFELAASRVTHHAPVASAQARRHSKSAKRLV